MAEAVTTLTRYPWLIVPVFAILILLILSIVGIIAYAVITGRSIKLWIIEIGPGGQKLNGDHGQKKDLNKLRDIMEPDLRPLLVFIEVQTLSRESVPQKDFDPPMFPNYAYWMLENLICLGFIEKERTDQRAGVPTFNYRLTREYKKILGRYA